ncbi:MAG TPA: ribosome-associated translation inhibitor RaiA [Gammaproteobacteria bacterium]|jgi:ribosomal subunit interface protein|nr:ribosome-associated translation inhibitor RaiA [Gammaproteobacteria bacterium]
MLPVQVTIRDIPTSSALETRVREKAEKLNRFYRRINSCRVVIDVPQKHKRQGKLFNVRIDITIPGKELVVTHKLDQDVYVAVRDAFKAVERQLEEHAHRQHGWVKTHHNGNGVDAKDKAVLEEEE